MLRLTRLVGGGAGGRLMRQRVMGKVSTGKISPRKLLAGTLSSSLSSGVQNGKGSSGTRIGVGRGGTAPKEVRKHRTLRTGLMRSLLVTPPNAPLAPKKGKKASASTGAGGRSPPAPRNHLKKKQEGQELARQYGASTQVLRPTHVRGEKGKKAVPKPPRKKMERRMEHLELEHDDPSARPLYMTEELEKKVLKKAERMRDRDLSGDYPVPSFVLELLKLHPSVRKMGLRERIDFVCSKWEVLTKAERKAYVRNPLKGLIPEADEL